MRNELIRLFSATLLASTALTVACADYTGTNQSKSSGGSGTSAGGSSSSTSSSTGSSTGGTSASTGGTGASTGGTGASTGGTGASTGGSSAASCPSTTFCGSGDVTGTWTVTSSCLTLSDEFDFTSATLGCATAPITGGKLEVTGTFTANSGGVYEDNTNTKGTVNFILAPACLSISNSPPSSCSNIAGSLKAAGFTTKTVCTTNSSGGCDCQGDVDNGQGSMGVPSGSAATDDMFTTDNNVLTLMNGHDQMPYSYCVSGDTLTLIPKPEHPTYTGAIVLQKQ